MPDAFGRPTEEERILAAYASNRMSPAMGSGMGNAMLSPEQLAEMSKSQEGKTLALKNQLAQANAMRQTPAAQGKTVGPYDLYMGPNWGDVANSVGSQLVGGYMGAKAQQGLDKVDEQASSTGLAKAKQAEALRIDEANKAAEALDYGRGRDTVSDEQWQKGFENTVGQQGIVNKQWEKGYGLDVNADARAAQKLLDDAQQANLDRETDIEVARLKYAADQKEASNARSIEGVSDETLSIIDGLPVAAQNKVRENMTTYLNLQDVIDSAGDLMSEGKGFTGNEGFLTGLAENMVPDSMNDWARQTVNKKVYNEGALAVKGDIANAVEQFKRTRTGANLTAIEKAMGADWDPAAAVSTEEAVKRMIALQKYLNNNFSTYGVPAMEVSAFPEVGKKAQTEDDDVPAGVDPEDWKYMSEDEKALFR